MQSIAYKRLKMQAVKDFDLCFVDTETSGPEPHHELIEIGIVKVSGYNFAVLDEWEAKIKPLHIELANQQALEVNHYKEEDWRNAIDLEDAMKTFLEKANNTILTGHNLLFDWFFITKALGDLKLEPNFYYKGLDTFSLGWQKLRHSPDIHHVSLAEMATHFGIVQERRHSALDDARTTYKVFLKLVELENA